MFNVIVFFAAKFRLPEFDGFKGRTYPGTQNPRSQEVLPRRPSISIGNLEQKVLLRRLKNKENINTEERINSAVMIQVRPWTKKNRNINISYI